MFDVKTSIHYYNPINYNMDFVNVSFYSRFNPRFSIKGDYLAIYLGFEYITFQTI